MKLITTSTSEYRTTNMLDWLLHSDHNLGFGMPGYKGGMAYLLELLTVVAAVVTGWVQLGCDEAVPFLNPPAPPPSVSPHG